MTTLRHLGNGTLRWWALGLALLAAGAAVAVSPVAAQSPPAAPDSVSITRGDRTLNVSWSDVSGASFNVNVSGDHKGSWSRAKSGVNTTYTTITGVENSGTYYVAVQSVGAGGNSGWTNSSAAGPYTPPNPPNPPGAPVSVSISRGDGTLTVSWGPSIESTSYNVNLSDNGKASWTRAKSGATGASATFSATNGATYYAAVQASNSGGLSPWKNSSASGPYTPPTTPVDPGPTPTPSPTPTPTPTPTPGPTPTPTPTPTPLTPPGAPASVSVTRGEATLNVTWPAVDGAVDYHVTYTNAGPDRGWVLAAANHTSNSITINHVLNAAKYIVAVRARNAAGYGPWTNSPETGYFLSDTEPPDKPDAVTLTRGNGTVTATWDAVDSATGYHVGYSANLGISFHRLVTSYTDTTVTFDAYNNRPYYVGVMAINGAGESGWRDSEVAQAISPSQPSSVTVTRSDGTLHVDWPDEGAPATYHVTYNSTDSWGWTLAAYGHTTTDIDITGVDNAKTYIVGVRAMNEYGNSKWRNSSAAGPYTAPPPPIPGAPANLAVAPGDGFLDITWDASTGATGYDVRAKASGGTSTWISVASNISATSHRYTTSLTIDYVAVRARNASGASDWAQVSRLPSSEMLNVATGEVSGMGGIAMAESNIASGQSEVSGQSNQVSGQSQLSAPTWGTINRTVVRQKAEIDLNWTHSGGWATGFNLVCSDTDGWTWNVCGWEDDGTVAYTSVPTAESRPVTLTHYRRGSDSPHTPGDYDFGKSRHYTVAIRAVNANPSQASDWVRTQIIRPIFPALRNGATRRTDDSITLSWTPNPWTTGYKVYCDNYTSGGTYNPSYELCATLTNQSHDDATHSVTITKSGGTHNWSSLDNTSILDIAIDSSNATGSGRWLAPLIVPPATLTASHVTKTTATLTIGRHSDQWWYKANAAPHATCQGPVASGKASKALTGLTSYTTYTYKAYDASGCAAADEIATASAFTTGVSASNLSETNASTALNFGTDWGQEFTTGSAANGYKLQSVTLDFGAVANASNITVSIREQQSNNHPATTDKATLTGTPAAGQVTFTCSGAGCNLNASTTYFVFAGGNTTDLASNMRSTASNNETLQPSNNGWSIADGVRYAGGNWALHSSGVSMKVKIEALGHPSLAGSSTSTTGGTLTISQHTGSWYYKDDTAPHTSCQGPVSTSSVTLSSLTAGTSYTYTAYSDSGCATPLASATFTTPSPPSLTASNVGKTTATLTVGNHTAQWWYKADVGPHTTCQGPVAAGTASKDLTGLTANTSYTYKAYSATGCASANLLATASAFTTAPGNPQSVSVGGDNFDGNIRRYPVSWNKPANTQASDTFAYQVECTGVNDRNTTDWTACGTINVASTSNTNLSQQVQHGWSDPTFKYVRVRTEKNGLYSDWVIAKTTFGS